MKQIQPEGPYYLGGFCLGGQVAFEMAKLLEKDGEKVALLGIIDTYNFQGERLDLSFTERLSSMRQQVSFHFVNLIKLGITEQARYLFRKAKGFYVRESETAGRARQHVAWDWSLRTRTARTWNWNG